MIGSMNLRRIESFLSVAELGGFRLAAEALNRSQSAISTHVRELEEELGVPLLHRTTRRVSLTSEGRLLMHRCRSVLADLRGVARELAEHSDLRRGHVSIGTVPSVSTHRLPAVFARFQKLYPGVTLELHEGSASRMHEDLQGRITDFAVGPRTRDSGAFAYEPVFQDPFVAVLPKSLGPAQRELTLREVARFDQICQTRDTAVRAQVESAFRTLRLGFEPKIEVVHHQTVIAMVAAGLGVALLPSTCIPGEPSRAVRVVPLRAPRLVREICIVTLKGKTPSPAAVRCAEMITATLRKGRPG
jgi:DNA-binding transcriptional LysR family regulator